MSITKNSELSLLYNSKEMEEQIALFDLQSGCDQDHAEVNYSDLYKYTDEMEAFLKEKGVGPGKRVVLAARNSLSLVSMLLAIWRLRALAIPVDFRITANELSNIFHRVEADLLVKSDILVMEDLEEKLAEKRELLFSLEGIAKKGSSNSLQPSPNSEDIDDDFPALIILTSGTTGMPKGAVHSYLSILKNLKELSSLVSLDRSKKVLMPLPASHIFGLEVILIAILTRASTIFCDLEPKSFGTAINRFEPEIVAGVPTIYSALLAQGSSKINLKKAEVLLSGGAPLPLPMAKAFEKEFGHRLNNGYGSTESKIICLNIEGPLESVGRPIPSVVINIVGDNESILDDSEVGEIYIKSDLLMTEYLNQPEKTQEVLTEKGYRTGDLGYLNDGYLFISGREKEMIIVAGNKVFPIEVEQVLSRSPLVQEIAITGVDHKRLGQIVKATIVINDEALSKGLEDSAEDKAKAAKEQVLKELKEYSKENLKRELRPMVWDIRPLSNPLPKTRSGKIDKKIL